jgi:hypothetical protein
LTKHPSPEKVSDTSIKILHIPSLAAIPILPVISTQELGYRIAMALL